MTPPSDSTVAAHDAALTTDVNSPTSSGRSLVWRLVRGASLWALPLLALSAFVLTWIYRESTYRIFDDPLQSTLSVLVQSAQAEPKTDQSGTAGPDIRVDLDRRPQDERYQQALSGRYWVMGDLDESGIITPYQASPSLYGATLAIPADDAAQILKNLGQEVRTTSVGPDQDVLRVVARSLVFPGFEDRPVVMLAAADRTAARSAVRNFAITALLLIITLMTGLFLAILWQVRVGLKPLFDLRSRVADVREGRIRAVEGRYPKEIHPLADELNTLIQHNRDVVERAQTHVGNLAHALKTPLAVLQNEARGTATPLGEIVGRQTDEMTKQVDHHLRRARAAARGQSIGARTDVTPVLTGLARTLERIYSQKDIGFDVTIDSGLIFRGEQRDLEEMAGNLLDNACKWTRDTVILTAIRDKTDPLKFSLTVEDNGKGLDPSAYSEVLKRGARMDEATPGSGLGLAIVDDLAQAYSGTLTLGQADPHGLRVVLELPCARPDAEKIKL